MGHVVCRASLRDRLAALFRAILEHVLGLAANVDALAGVQATLEAEGIEFLGGDAPGVRLHPKMPT